MMVGEEEPAIGIDLGTTNSCVAVWRNGRAEVISNDWGKRVTPCCVAFNDDERLVGDEALDQIAGNPTNTIFDVQRMIGGRFSDGVVQKDMKTWPFRVVRGKNNRPTIVVQYRKEEMRFLPEDISAMFLSKMKNIASDFLGREVKKAVVTVPAYFNNAQRKATRDAAKNAGLEVIQIINKPAAAALAYSFHNQDRCFLKKKTQDRCNKKKILIFDLGGGTIDVSVLELDGLGGVNVLATSGDIHLGGQNFDDRMVNHVVDVIKKRQKEDVRKLKSLCEKAKMELSTQLETRIDIEGLEYGINITRAYFEDLNRDLFERCIKFVDECIKRAKVLKSSIAEVVLAGGSSRIPKVRELLQTFFDGKRLGSSINEDEVVAVGASIQAAILNGDKKEQVTDLVLLQEVTPLSQGLPVKDSLMSADVPKRTRIPCTREKMYKASEDVEIMNSSGKQKTVNEFKSQPGSAAASISGKSYEHAGDDSHDDDEKTRKARDELRQCVSRIESLLNDDMVTSVLSYASGSAMKSAADMVRDWLTITDDAADCELEEKKNMLKNLWEPLRIKLLQASTMGHRGDPNAGRHFRPNHSTSIFLERRNFSHQRLSSGADCQICGRQNHIAIDCYHRFNRAYRSRSTPQLNQVSTAYKPWHLDNGSATRHVTANSLDSGQNYVGPDQFKIPKNEGFQGTVNVEGLYNL